VQSISLFCSSIIPLDFWGICYHIFSNIPHPNIQMDRLLEQLRGRGKLRKVSRNGVERKRICCLPAGIFDFLVDVD
jgi:hypothetical protein